MLRSLSTTKSNSKFVKQRLLGYIRHVISALPNVLFHTHKQQLYIVFFFSFVYFNHKVMKISVPKLNGPGRAQRYKQTMSYGVVENNILKTTCQQQ